MLSGAQIMEKMQNKKPVPRRIGRSGAIVMFAGIVQSDISPKSATMKGTVKSCAERLIATKDIT